MRLTILLLSLLFLGACSNNVGPSGLAIGGPCLDLFDCVTGSFCLRGPDFPSGQCTTNCDAVSDCRAGSTCADVESGVCLLTCETDDECRPNYVCQERSLVGESSPGLVCIAP